MTAEQLKASLLQMAIQGKLVPQLDDEPAVDIDAEEPEEVPFVIPEKWKWVRLGECAQINPKIAANDDTDVSFVPMPLLQAGFGSNIDISNIKKWKNVKKGFTKFCNNDVLLAKITPCFENRKSAIVVGAKNGIGAGTTELHVFRCKRYVLPEYLLYFFKTSYLIQFGVEHFRGTAGQQRIGATEIKHCPFPLPPLAEQRRIVDRLNELLPLVEEYGKSQRALQALETELPGKLRASLLQQAIMGKLVPQLDDEPAVDIDAEEPEEVPFAIPEKWKWVRLGECAQINPKIAANDDTDVSFVPMPLLQAGFGSNIDISNIKKWKNVKKGFTKFCNNDVLLAKITPCFENRKSAIVVGAKNGIGAGTTELHVFRCKRYILPEYLLYFFKTSYLIQFGVEHFKGTAGQQRIGATEIKHCPFPLPPLAEQRRIVARLNELSPYLDRIN